MDISQQLFLNRNLGYIHLTKLFGCLLAGHTTMPQVLFINMSQLMLNNPIVSFCSTIPRMRWNKLNSTCCSTMVQLLGNIHYNYLISLITTLPGRLLNNLTNVLSTFLGFQPSFTVSNRWSGLSGWTLGRWPGEDNRIQCSQQFTTKTLFSLTTFTSPLPGLIIDRSRAPPSCIIITSGLPSWVQHECFLH